MLMQSFASTKQPCQMLKAICYSLIRLLQTDALENIWRSWGVEQGRFVVRMACSITTSEAALINTTANRNESLNS